MNELPDPATYDQEMRYFPWRHMVTKAIDMVTREAPGHARVADLMCGTGYVLREISKRRPDLHLVGVDISGEFIGYAQSLSDDERCGWEVSDVLRWEPNGPFQVLLCMAGMHHLPFGLQEPLVRHMEGLLSAESGSLCLVAESCLSVTSGPESTGRRLAAAELGYAYLTETIHLGGSDSVIRAAARIIENDVMCDGEWKRSAMEIERLLAGVFPSFEKDVGKTWPHDSGSNDYGDYWWKLTRR